MTYRVVSGIAAALFLTTTLSAATFTVNDAGDASDAAPGAGGCATAANVCTLRAAIEEANASAGFDTIVFSGAMVITPATAFPAISQPVTIDGSPGVVEIDGGPVANGFQFAAGSGGSTLTGLDVHGFDTAVVIDDGSVIVNRNVIHDNSFDGIAVSGNSLAVIDENIIGLLDDGTTGAGNGGFGVLVASNAMNVTITNNTISFNGFGGIGIFSSSNVSIGGNVIGLTADGTDVRGNGGSGISTNGSSNLTVGGGSGRNVISGNSISGLDLTDTSASQVSLNYIGTDGSGNDAPGGAVFGNLESGVALGGSSTGIDVFSNVISGNAMHGVRIFGLANANRVYLNVIGQNVSEAASVPNAVGVLVENNAANNVIGSETLGGNHIEGNTGNGVTIDGEGTGNTVQFNSIVNNGGLGIDLQDNGVTLNDAGDPDPGPNALQNFPVITAAVTDAFTTWAEGTFNSNANDTFTLDFYAGGIPDPSGYGEGRTHLGKTTVSTDGSGDAAFAFAGTGITVGNTLTVTATSADGTSEFSQGVVLAQAPQIQFDPTSYTVNEAAGTATLTVTRTGDLSVTSSVTFTTANNLAVSPGDYTGTSGTVTFTPTESSKTISITIIDDNVYEAGPENFFVQLSDPVAASIGAGATANVFITDNDPLPQISINDVTANEGDSGTTAFTFTVSLDRPSATSISVDATAGSGSASDGIDYNFSNVMLTIAPGTLSTTYTVDVTGETRFESDENFFVTLSNPSGAAIFDGSGEGTILNDDAQPTISIDDVTQLEGDAGSTFIFNIQLSNASDSPVDVTVNSADGTATSGSDYFAVAGQVVTVTPGQLTQGFAVTVLGDTVTEPDETFVLNLSNPSGGTIADAQGTGTILNDDAPPDITVGDATTGEGDLAAASMLFVVSLSNASAFDVSFDVATSDGTATGGVDYVPLTTTTITIPAGSVQANVTVNTIPDLVAEPDETLFLNLSNASGGTITDATGNGTIFDDDSPVISINDVSLPEGDSGTTAFTFTISLSAPSTFPVTVDLATADGTAVAGPDYAALSTTLTFPPLTTSQTVTVNVVGDTMLEPWEQFTVTLSNPTNATLGDGNAIGQIENDDATPALSVADVSLPEGNSGTTPFTFTLNLSNPNDQPIDVTFTTTDSGATTGTDYTPFNGVVTIPAGATSQTFTVDVVGDLFFETDEQFRLTIEDAGIATVANRTVFGTIVNDDTQPGLSINDVTLAEGTGGTTAFTFTISLSAARDSTVTVEYNVAAGTAALVDDVFGTGGVLVFDPGVTTQTFTATVVADNLDEPNETFFVNLSNPFGAALADGQGLGTIVDDDATPTISIDDVTLNEGNAGTTAFTFTLSLSSPSASAITLDAATADASAVAPDDYTANGTTITFAAGTLTATFTVDVNGDTLPEPDELFSVDLTNASGATIADNQGLGTIVNDDVAPASADLSVQKAASSPTFAAGQEITFTLTAANAGPDAATNVTITDVLPSGLSFVSAASADAACSGTTIVTCTIASLAVDQVATVTLVATASGTSEITNSASVSAGEADPAPADNVASATIAPAAAPPVAQIPTASEWALVMLMLALGAAAVMRVGR